VAVGWWQQHRNKNSERHQERERGKRVTRTKKKKKSLKKDPTAKTKKTKFFLIEGLAWDRSRDLPKRPQSPPFGPEVRL
jgi:hypothetical protein